MKKKVIEDNFTAFYDLPLGVYQKNGISRFLISLPKALSSMAYLFDGNDKVGEIELLKKKNGLFFGQTDICFDSYVITADEMPVKDLYAKVVKGRDLFAKRKASESKIGIKPGTEYCFGVSEELDEPSLYQKHGFNELILYKLQVRSFTNSNTADVVSHGTFKGVAEKTGYLKKLGITGVLLMPCYDYDECFDLRRVNLWGFGAGNTCYYAPKAAFASDKNHPQREFFDMVEYLHKNHIDVYMEMSFGPGFPKSRIFDVLKYWVMTYGIDGFRLYGSDVSAEALADDPFLKNTVFFMDYVQENTAIREEGRILKVDRDFCDNARKFVKGDEGYVPFIYDCIKNRGFERGLKYITDHDGFSLYDLYAYDLKHNEENGEFGRDGTDFNNSWNCGTEGDDVSTKVRTLRYKMIKNAITVNILSGGIPMIVAGDEFGHTKKGNNNTYCQDNEISWLDWGNFKKNRQLFDFTKDIIEFRKKSTELNKTTALKETEYSEKGFPEISLHGLTPWMIDKSPYNRSCGIYISEQIDGDFLIIYNMHWEEAVFELPNLSKDYWKVIISTDKKTDKNNVKETFLALPRSITILRKTTTE